MPCAACVKISTWPASSVGRKPLGAARKPQNVPITSRSRVTIASAPMTHHPGEAAAVGFEGGVEPAFSDLVKAAVALGPGRAQETAAEHRREGQRDEARNQDRDADRDGELVQQAADESRP